MHSVTRRYLSVFDSVETRYWQVLFFSLTFVYTAVLVNESLTYPRQAKLPVLFIGIPLLILQAIKVALDVTGFTVGSEDSDPTGFDVDAKDETPLDMVQRYYRQVSVIGWLIAVVVGLWFFGFPVVSVVFVFAFSYVYERNLWASVVATLIVGFVMFFVFNRLLPATLWGGVVPLPGPL